MPEYRWKALVEPGIVGQWKQRRAGEDGFHPAKRIVDAISMEPHLSFVVKVEVQGNDLEDTYTCGWAEMRVIEVWTWTQNDSLALAIFAAEQVIHVYEVHHPHGDVPRKAIDAAIAYQHHPTPASGHAADVAAQAAAVRYSAMPVVLPYTRRERHPAADAAATAALAAELAAVHEGCALTSTHIGQCLRAAVSASRDATEQLLDQCEHFIRARLQIQDSLPIA